MEAYVIFPYVLHIFGMFLGCGMGDNDPIRNLTWVILIEDFHFNCDKFLKIYQNIIKIIKT